MPDLDDGFVFTDTYEDNSDSETHKAETRKRLTSAANMMLEYLRRRDQSYLDNVREWRINRYPTNDEHLDILGGCGEPLGSYSCFTEDYTTAL